MEIKFRGFSIENNCWIYGFYHEVEVEGIRNAYIFWQGESWNVDNKSVGMSTGLIDKNKIRMYSGDIVKHEYEFGKGLGEIVYYPPSFKLDDGKATCDDFTWEDWEDFEVIGNTYENSNLIN